MSEFTLKLKKILDNLAEEDMPSFLKYKLHFVDLIESGGDIAYLAFAHVFLELMDIEENKKGTKRE